MKGDRTLSERLHHGPLPLDVLQQKILPTFDFFKAVDRADVRMILRGEHLRLALKAGQPVRIIGQLLRQDLDRHLPIETRAPGEINLSHPSRPKEREDLV